MLTLVWGLPLSAALAAPPGPDIVAHGRWRVVGLYDTSPLLAEQGHVADGEPWRPAPGMNESCDAVRRPFGLNAPDMAAISSGVSPALVVLLRGEGEDLPLERDDLRVSLKERDHSFRLEPMVTPMALRVEIVGDAERRYQEQVRTQIETELCLEHKVGRAWIGGSSSFLKQAFRLQDPPSRRPDQGAFAGQLAPVPALLGAPDACVVEGEGASPTPAERQGVAADSLDLVDADIWGASLRSCGSAESALGAAPSVNVLPWTLAGSGPSPATRALWRTLRVTLHDGPEPTFDLDIQSQHALDQWRSIVVARPLVRTVAAGEEGAGRTTLTDLVALLPRELPVLSANGVDARYTLVVLPEWQVELGLRRLYSGEGSNPDLDRVLSTAGTTPADAVGWVLAHPELLKVQVRPADQTADAAVAQLWPDLMASLSSTLNWPGAPGDERLLLRWRDWGFPAGVQSARAPIALPGEVAPAPDLVAQAQRTAPHAVFLGATSVLAFILVSGLRRARDLWSAVPEERVSYWPMDGEPAPEVASPPKPPQAEPSR